MAVEPGWPVVWSRTSAESAVHQPGMEAANPDGLRRRLLAERPKFVVELTKQGEISTRNSWKHEEQP